MSVNKSKVLRTAEKYVLQGKIPAAIDEYRKVVDADPSDLTTINTLGDLYVRAGRIQDAISNFSRIADSYREGGFTLKAIAMLKKISKLDPTNVETAMKLANLYSQQGLLVEARQQYLQVADAYARAGQTRKALEAYQKIADLDPSNTSVRMKLAEIYSREKMPEQAHEAFIMAGAEFLRKGDVEQALNANLKAIVINPDSRQALTAIATIYTEQGQIERAINILCEAFERNPGDIELLTILGRTYLSAGMMDDSERTFLSLVELDKNRYHYLLEVGRRFLQVGELDRAAEQIDGCMEVLIGKREEDKAIDFLRRILDRDMNHIGALKRLAQIFNRIREDHNLIATLNSLVEASMKKGNEAEAIAALKELARIEPDEPMHLQRLYNLGVRDIVEAGSPDVVRATGPLDYQSAAFDDTFVIRQISEAEILAGHGQVEHAVSMLKEILNHAPENVQVHQKLKDIYLRAGLMEEAAAQCLELARIHEARGETARASDFLAEGRMLNPMLASASAPGVAGDFGWGDMAETSASQAPAAAASNPYSQSDAGFNQAQSGADLDWKRYETGKLDEDDPAVFAAMQNAEHEPPAVERASENQAIDSFGFSFADIVADDDETSSPAPQPIAPADPFAADVPENVFESAVNVSSDLMASTLRDELEGIDFYIAQGYLDIARDTLDRLLDQHGEHPEITSRYRQLDAYTHEPQQTVDGSQGFELNLEAQHAFDSANLRQEAAPQDQLPDNNFGEQPFLADNNGDGTDAAVLESLARSPHDEYGFEITAIEPSSNKRKTGPRPFLIQKESGPLYPDLVVQLNTSELLNNTAFDPMRPLTGPVIASTDVGATADESSDAGSTFTDFDLPSGAPAYELPETIIDDVDPLAPDSEFQTGERDVELTEAEAFADLDASVVDAGWDEPVELPVQPAPPLEVRPARDELQAIFDELKGTTGDLTPLVDFETHFSLGLAYKDMDLLDEAIEEFQMAFRIAGLQNNDADYIHCCNMLGVCFHRKQMQRVAVMWFHRGLKVPNRPEDEYQALRYEMGLCYEELNEIDKAIDAFTEVYGIDVNYREVSGKLDQLQSLKNAC